MSTDRTAEILNYVSAISRDVGALREAVARLDERGARIQLCDPAVVARVDGKEAVAGDRITVFLGHPKLQGLPALLEVPGTDGHGPDAAQMAKLRALYAKATKRGSARKRETKARRPAARGTRG